MHHWEAEMKIQIRKGILKEHATGAAVVALFEGESGPGQASAILDKESCSRIEEIIRMGDFQGRLNQTALLYTLGQTVKRILLVGLGKRLDFSIDRLRGSYARAAQQIRSIGITEFSTSLHIVGTDLSVERMAEAVVEGVILGLYRFLPFKTQNRDQD